MKRPLTATNQPEIRAAAWSTLAHGKQLRWFKFPTPAIALPAVDRGASKNQHDTAEAPTSQFPFPTFLQNAGNGNWEVRVVSASSAGRSAIDCLERRPIKLRDRAYMC